MKELTKVFKKVDIPVEVLDEDNMWFDISGVAKKYGKNITDWKNSNRVVETIKLLEKSNTLDLIKVEKKAGSQVQTKIHKKLFVSFARFISVEFEIEADKIITEILLGEKKLCEQQFNELQKQIEMKDEKIKQLSEKVYAKPNGDGFETVHRIIANYNIDINSHELNEILHKRGLLKRKTVEKYIYLSNNMRGQTPLVHEDTVISILDSLGYKREKGYIDTHPSLFDF
jgi:hypothetical protein